MIRFKEFLNEIFDNPYKHTIVDDYSGVQEHKFKTENGNEYAVFIHHKGMTDNNPEIEFNSRIDNKISIHPNGAEKYTAHRVFSTVKDITHKYLKNNPHVSHITYSAYNEDPTKVKLYHSLSRSVDPNYIHKTDRPDKYNSSTYFKIKNPYHKE